MTCSKLISLFSFRKKNYTKTPQNLSVVAQLLMQKIKTLVVNNRQNGKKKAVANLLTYDGILIHAFYTYKAGNGSPGNVKVE